MPARPIRVKIKNELGNPTTLPEGEQYLRFSGQGPDVLILCPGPHPQICVPLLPGTGQIFLLHAPDFEIQMPPSWHAAIPPTWKRVNQAEALDLLQHVQILQYTPASRMFPSLFEPILARQAKCLGPPRPLEIWIPGSDRALIVRELCHAALTLGYIPQTVPQDLEASAMRNALEQSRPGVFVSINFNGLDSFGENQALLEAASVPVAVWCVDNPFHLLSAQKNLLWKRLPIFVTDDWFLEPLAALGVRASHLPLGVSPEFFAPAQNCPTGNDVAFVGRSRFPDRDRFFAACSVPADIQAEALAQEGRSAHFGWWQQRLGHSAWPGNDVRRIGFGAEKTSESWRTRVLQHLATTNSLHIVGDSDWATLVPAATLCRPVDYYSGLANVYRQASFSLNLTSLLLPNGLTQRNFDVWACGGFLLTDASLGLKIFPKELTLPVTFESPEHASELVAEHAHLLHRKEELRKAWQHHILTEHTYVTRLELMLKTITEGSVMTAAHPA